MFVAAVFFAEEEILERSVPRKRQTEEEIGVGVIKVRRRASAERRGTAGELEAGLGRVLAEADTARVKLWAPYGLK